MKKGKLINSFRYAFAGIFFCLRYERNVQIHCLAACVVSFFGFYFHVTKTEWLILILTIGIVFALEIVNTAVEKAVDLVTMDVKPLAKIAKDAAAGAVLVFSIIAVVIGAIIFGPYMI
ncbi:MULTISPECIES: diacylglycerol kinase family protein [unclassified Bacillus (in: firmicutes)]|uniref:diacylglycerol kinase family protein n=1 Tax=unclassified Bacillus (in: firmicutes) TaxID=185979 RepID=UPI00232BDBC4|nr:diacylglycerol kinase family protein [Bacillus sp. BP-3]MDC2863366.1 diacylglycerol kinase family protein [Bacillus sp. BP-3]